MEKGNSFQGYNEIDLFDLLIKFVRFTRRNLIFITVCIVIGFLFSIIYFYSQSKKYELKIIVDHKIISKPLFYELLSSYINNPISKSNNQFNLSNFSNIKKINIDTSNFTFSIKFLLSDTNNYKTLVEEFLRIVNNDDYLVKQSLKYIKNKKNIHTELITKLAELDSIQKLIKNNLLTNKKDFISVNPYYAEYFKLFEWKIQIENELNNFYDGEKIQPINIINEEIGQVKINLIFIMLISLFVSCIFAYFVLIFIKIWKLAK